MYMMDDEDVDQGRCYYSLTDQMADWIDFMEEMKDEREAENADTREDDHEQSDDGTG